MFSRGSHESDFTDVENENYSVSTYTNPQCAEDFAKRLVSRRLVSLFVVCVYEYIFLCVEKTGLCFSRHTKAKWCRAWTYLGGDETDPPTHLKVGDPLSWPF